MVFTGCPIFRASFGTGSTGSPRHTSANTLNKPPEFTKKTKNYSLKKNFAEKSFKDVSKGRSGRFFDSSSCCDTALYW
jgi:hypothetical protein